MEHIINKSIKYHQAKKGFLEDGIFSYNDTYEIICGLIIFYLKSIKEDNYFPEIDLKILKKQKNYYNALSEIKKTHYQKISSKDKKIFFLIFLSLELDEKSKNNIQKI